MQMMVAEYNDRNNNSPINGETPLHSSGPINNSSNTSNSSNSNTSGGGAGVVGNGTLGCNGSYCYIEPNSELGMMTRDNGESGSGDDMYPPNYDMNGHLQRKDLFSQRKQREFIPDNKKDESYWDRRRRNNEAAKRSREKRRYNDMILEQRVMELSKENHFLKAQLKAIKDKYGISGETVVNVEQVMATLPTNDQILSITKRAKLSNNGSPVAAVPPAAILYPPTSVPIPTPVIHRTNAGPSPPLVPLHPVYADNDSFTDTERYPFPFNPVLPPLHPPILEATNSVLNLSRSRSSPSPYELPLPPAGEPTPPVNGNSTGNNSLPHKLRHKSHLGDKDVAATALLSLHNIKQEPGSRASPPWDAEGSSDERDSGISLGSEWIMAHNLPNESHRTPPHECIEHEDDDSHLKSEVARLASEVATLKSMLSRKKPTPVTSVN